MLKDKVVLVTGGAGLIGQEFIRAIIENNGIAIIADINESLGLSVKNEISLELNTTNIDFVKLDITSSKSIINCISFVKNKYYKIDALVNNAYPRNKIMEKISLKLIMMIFLKIYQLNLGGYFLTSQKFSFSLKIKAMVILLIYRHLRSNSSKI